MSKQFLILAYISIFIAATTLSAVFISSNLLLGVAAIVLTAMAWGIFILRDWGLGSFVCMLLFVLGISSGGVLRGSQHFLLITLLAILSAWDLGTFYGRLSANMNVNNQNQLIKTHLIRLVAVLMMGLALPLLALGLQFDLEFWQVFLLGGLLLAGLSQVFIQIKRSAKN